MSRWRRVTTPRAADTVCECGDCDLTWTDCCEGLRPVCETTPIFDSDGTVDVMTCRYGYGCDANNPDREP